MRRDKDPYQDLLRELTRAIVLDTGTREQIATQYAEAAMACLQRRKAENGLVYVGAPPRQYDVLQIRAALERGESHKQVRQRFGLSRSKLYELFPGGLPEPQNDTQSRVSQKRWTAADSGH